MKTQQRVIVGAVIQSGRIYKAGDEDALLVAMKGHSVAHLSAKGVITGDWSDAPAVVHAPVIEPDAADASEADEPSEESEAGNDAGESDAEKPSETNTPKGAAKTSARRKR